MDPALDLETLRRLGPLTVISNHEKPPGYGEGGFSEAEPRYPVLFPYGLSCLQ